MAAGKTSAGTWLIAILLGGFFVFYLAGRQTSDAPAAPREPTASERAIANTKLDFNWRKTGFGAIMEADFIVRNANAHAIKDVGITCLHSAKSGTSLGSSRKTIYDIVRAKSTKKFAAVNMGFVDSQVNSSSCYIADLAIVQ